MGIEGLGRVKRAWDWCGGSRVGVQVYIAKEMCRGPRIGIEGLTQVRRPLGGCGGLEMSVKGQLKLSTPVPGPPHPPRPISDVLYPPQTF